MNGAAIPRYVAIETINACNARCPFCPLFQGDSIMQRSTRPATIMSAELFAKITSELATWPSRPESIFLNMNGEPLQDPHFSERLDVMRSLGLGTLIELQTNGQFLTESYAREILRTEIRRIVIGFDGATKETYAKHRVRCDFDRVLNNVKNFTRMRDDRASKTQVVIQYVHTKANHHEVAAAYELFGDFLDPARDVFQDDFAKDWGDTPSSDDIFLMNKVTVPRVPASECVLFSQQLIINSDGTIAACCWDYNLSVSGGGFGNTNEEPLLDIWNGTRRRNLAQRLGSKKLADKPEKCRSCIFMYEHREIPISAASLSDLSVVEASPYGLTYRFPSRV